MLLPAGCTAHSAAEVPLDGTHGRGTADTVPQALCLCTGLHMGWLTSLREPFRDAQVGIQGHAGVNCMGDCCAAQQQHAVDMVLQPAASY